MAIRNTRSQLVQKRFKLKDKLDTECFALPGTVKLWLLRLLAPLGGWLGLTSSHAFSGNDEVIRALGLTDWAEDRDLTDKKERAALKAQIQRMHLQAEKEASTVDLPGYLAANIAELGQTFGLNPVECRIVEAAVVLLTNQEIRAAINLFGKNTTLHSEKILSGMLGLRKQDIVVALSPRGVLSRSGFLTFSSDSDLQDRFNFISREFPLMACTMKVEPFDLMRGLLAETPEPELDLKDFEYFSAQTNLILAYLDKAMRTGRRGVNILLHGRPGTGKTQFARCIAAALKRPLFAVATDDEYCRTMDGDDRLRSYRAAQYLVRNRKALLLFDEAEDAFSGDLLRRSSAQKSKAWMNAMLEENAAPTFWLCNSINGIDPAFIRRFDMVLEMPVPSRQQRLRILDQACSDFLDVKQRERLAQSDALAPAVVMRAAAVVQNLRGSITEEKNRPKLSRRLSIPP